MSQINCSVVTPEETTLDVKAEFVALPLYDGEIGIAANRSPMIGRLGYGELRVKSDGQVSRYYVDGGFVQVANNIVTVLTSRSCPIGELDLGAAKSQLADAQKRPAHTDELREIRDRLISQARAQIKLAS